MEGEKNKRDEVDPFPKPKPKPKNELLEGLECIIG
jgi:hypothetical protein